MPCLGLPEVTENPGRIQWPGFLTFWFFTHPTHKLFCMHSGKWMVSWDLLRIQYLAAQGDGLGERHVEAVVRLGLEAMALNPFE